MAQAVTSLLHDLCYTVAPGRIFRRDSFNPFTNTVSLYSDIPSLALEQAAYAKDVRQRTYPGTYAAVQDLPFVGLWHESLSKEDVFTYLDVYGTPQERREADYVLCPQMGAEIGGEIGGVLPEACFLPSLAGAAVGHVVGRTRGERHLDQVQPTQPSIASRNTASVAQR